MNEYISAKCYNIIPDMSDQIASAMIDELVEEVAVSLRGRRISWADEVEAANGHADAALGANISEGAHALGEGAHGAHSHGGLELAVQADIRYPRGATGITMSTPTAPRGRGSTHPFWSSAPAPAPIIREVVTIQTRIVVMAEPYRGWRDELVRAFRDLRPQRVEGGTCFNSGYVGRVASCDLDGLYVVGAKYNINSNPGARDTPWTRVVESLIRGMSGNMDRCPTSGTPLPFLSGREKADTGLQIQVAIKPLRLALGLP